MPLRNILYIFLAAIISLACYGKAQRNREASRIAAAMRIVEDHYVEEVDRRQLYEGAMNGLVGVLDQYSSYIGPGDFQQFQESLEQEFGGIGIVVELDPESKRLTVMTPLVGTPAHEQGILAGDVILSIDGQDTADMEMKDSVALMRGKPGTPVSITLERAQVEEPIELTLQRAIIPIESVLGDTRRPSGDWNFILEGHPRIGYVRLTTFGEHSIEELTKALEQLEGQVDGLILDLRNNAGGLLSAAVEVCDMFLERGVIVSTRSRGGIPSDVYEARPGVLLSDQTPLVVLVNNYSASASEIVAACLQDHQRAVVVGDRSWGKGTVQNVIPIEHGDAAIKLTTASYWRPSGRNIHRQKDADESADWGVRPNPGLEVKLSEAEFERVMRERRERDIVTSGGDASSAPALDPINSPEPPAPENLGDPQLEKALEQLQKMIREAHGRRQKA